MTIQAELDNSDDTLNITVAGRFDFSTHKAFRESYESCEIAPKKFRIDMLEAEYIDSSALGMLLILRDHAGGDGANVEIVNCNPDVKKILTISNFDQLFSIH